MTLAKLTCPLLLCTTWKITETVHATVLLVFTEKVKKQGGTSRECRWASPDGTSGTSSWTQQESSQRSPEVLLRTATQVTLRTLKTSYNGSRYVDHIINKGSVSGIPRTAFFFFILSSPFSCEFTHQHRAGLWEATPWNYIYTPRGSDHPFSEVETQWPKHCFKSIRKGLVMSKSSSTSQKCTQKTWMGMLNVITEIWNDHQQENR